MSLDDALGIGIGGLDIKDEDKDKLGWFEIVSNATVIRVGYLI